MDENKITAIVFDVGNVLIEWNAKCVKKCIEYTYKSIFNIKINEEVLTKLYLAFSFFGKKFDKEQKISTTTYAQTIQELKIDSEEYLSLKEGFNKKFEVSENKKLDGKEFEVMRQTLVGYGPFLQDIKANQELLKILYKNKEYETYLLSDTDTPTAKFILTKFEKYINGAIFSCEVGYRKPDKEIYRKLEKDYDLKLSECVFIDDLKKNIEGAKKLGIQTIHLIEGMNLKDKLNQLGVQTQKNTISLNF